MTTFYASSVYPASAAETQACDNTSLFSVIDRGTSDTNPCTIGAHAMVLETGYYQNASALGGTQQAAYPLAHLRYGISNKTEIFVDPATRIAKSGLLGKGIYTWSRTGGGIKQTLINHDRNALSLRAAYTPQTDETASLSVRERYDLGIEDRLVVSPTFALGMTLGSIAFTQQNIRSNQSASTYLGLSLRKLLSSRLDATALVERDSRITIDARPQTSIGLSFHDRLSPHFVGDAEIGTALNGTGDTKAHYIGFGISAMR